MRRGALVWKTIDSGKHSLLRQMTHPTPGNTSPAKSMNEAFQSKGHQEHFQVQGETDVTMEVLLLC